MRHLVARAAAIAVLLSCPSALAVTRAESVARAKEWVAAQMPYCQCANHASDSHGVCDRPDNALWDPYRSDCSGLVSWAWGLAPPGHVTSTFAPYSGSVSHQIAPSELLPGDALNINENGTHHVVLFAGWVGSNVAHVIQESNWGKPANEAFWNVTIDGDRVVSWAPFIPIRFNSIQEDCDAHCEGSTIVAADCGKGDCAAYGAGCVDDALGVRCVFSLCPAQGEIDVCLPDGKTLGHCKDGALTSQGDCSQFAAWCSTAGGKPAHCASVFCVASPTDVAKPHDTCGINGSVLHCDDNGQPKESACAAGEKCSAVPAPHCQPNNGCPATGDVKLCVGEIAARCYEGTLVDGIDCKKQGETCQMVGNAPTCKTDAGGDPGMAGAGGASAGAGGAAGKAGSTAGTGGTGAKAGNAAAGKAGMGGSTAGAAGKAAAAGTAGKTTGGTGGNQTVSLPAVEPETESGSCTVAARPSSGGLSLLALSLAGLCTRRRSVRARR